MKEYSLLLKPASADCNLKCSYCFYLPKSALYPGEAVHRMKDAVLSRIVSSYMATDQPVYSFGWQGGEPTLMGLDFFVRVTELQVKHGKAGAEVANGLQTNGVLLTREFARHLAKFNFLTGISLDGPEELHDHFRNKAGGAGSHAEVIRATGIMRDAGADFNILTLVSSANVRAGKRVYEYLRDSGFLFHQYIPCVEAGPDGALLPLAISAEEWGDFLCSVFDAWIKDDTRRVSIRLFDSIMNLLVFGRRVQCTMMEDCRQYFLVEHNGDVYPCDFFVEPGLKLGNAMADSWDQMAESEVFRRFGRRKAERSAECAGCAYLDLCQGDCPKHRPGEAGGLSRLCAGWKMFYRHSLERFTELAASYRAETEKGGGGQ